MIERMRIVTNNPLSKEKFVCKYPVDFINEDVIGVFKCVRNYIHRGHRLLTHPLMSSIKPNETPYRTVLVTEQAEETVEIGSLNMIESAIEVTSKFIKNFGTPEWNENTLKDFQLIDLDIIFSSMN